MITFATHNLTPDPQDIIVWLVSEALAWFLSLPGDAALVVLCLLAIVVLVALFLLAERVLTWAVQQ